MVKAYYYNYRTVSTDSYDNFLIASNEDEARSKQNFKENKPS